MVGRKGLKDVDIISASIKSRVNEGSAIYTTKFNTTPVFVENFNLSLRGTGCPVTSNNDKSIISARKVSAGTSVSVLSPRKGSIKSMTKISVTNYVSNNVH